MIRHITWQQLQQKYPTCKQLNKAFPSLEMEENHQDLKFLLRVGNYGGQELISQIKTWF